MPYDISPVICMIVYELHGESMLTAVAFGPASLAGVSEAGYLSHSFGHWGSIFSFFFFPSESELNVHHGYPVHHLFMTYHEGGALSAWT